jgi:hypothetical protein
MTRWLLRFSVAIACVGSSVAACFDFDALSSGVPGGGPDAGAGDAAAPGEASDSATGYCASLVPQPLFCEDFDRTSLPGRWNVWRQTGGAMDLDTSAFLSPPNSLLAQYDALQPGQALDVLLRKQFTFATFPSKLVFEYFVQPLRVDSAPNAATVIASLDFNDAPGNRYSLQFSLVQNFGAVGVRFEEQTGLLDGGTAYTNHPLPDGLPLGTWTDVRVEVTGPHARVTFGTVLEIDTPLALTVVPTRLQLALGSSYETEPSMGWATHFDNITLGTPP